MGDLVVKDMARLPLTVAAWKASLAIITDIFPLGRAATDRLAAVGVQGVLNLSSTPLPGKGKVVVKDICIVECLEELSCRLKQYRRSFQKAGLSPAS